MIVPFESAVKRFHSKDHAVTALTPPDMPGRRSHDPRYTTIRDATARGEYKDYHGGSSE